MNQWLGIVKSFLVYAAPIVTGSVLTSSPILAATTAFSEARLDLDSFSYVPTEVVTLTDTNTFIDATSGLVTATADANATATFDLSNPPSRFSNFSISTASGEGDDYFGLAQSKAAVIGYNFLVEASRPFSFNFTAFLQQNTSVDTPQVETASARGNLAFKLYDTTDSNNWQLLDFFKISSNLATPGNTDFLRTNKSNNVTVNSSQAAFNPSTDGTKESAIASVQGWFSRMFEKATSLTLVEFKRNQARVRASGSSCSVR